MREKNILDKALKKAVENGWDNNARLVIFSRPDGSLCFKSSYFIYEFDVASVIFNHDFARALWGDTHFIGGTTAYPLVQFEEHLSQMVISEDPIKYLGENI